MLTAALHLTAAALVAASVRAPSFILLLSLALALLPDLDTPQSLPGRLLPWFSRPLERAVGHRTATHSLLALTLVAAVFWLVLHAWWGVLAGAYASHLLIDMLIGRTGLQLFWPSRTWHAIARWRDDGPAPRIVLTILLLVLGGVSLWPYLSHEARAQVAALSPIATPKPSVTPTRVPTQRPSIHLAFALPPHVGLSVLTVRAGDSIHEGQVLARWLQPTPTPWPTGTPPPTQPSPVAPPLPEIIAPATGGETSAVVQAQAALAALQHAQPAERAALVAKQAQELIQAEQAVKDAERALGQLQPLHERAQQEAQHAVDAANVALVDAQGAALYDDRMDPAATQRLQEGVHDAEAVLMQTIDAQDRMRSTQGTERQEAEAALTQARRELDALPTQHAAVLAQLDADHKAALTRAQGSLAAAQAAAGAEARRAQVAQQQLAATVAALRHALAATATAEGYAWAERATATVQAHGAALGATQQALPTPAPDRVISRASGHVVGVTAEEKDGVLIVTLEVVP